MQLGAAVSTSYLAGVVRPCLFQAAHISWIDLLERGVSRTAGVAAVKSPLLRHGH